MCKKSKTKKTVRDFIEETTFRLKSEEEREDYILATSQPVPYSESLKDIRKLLLSIYEKNKRADYKFDDFANNVLYTCLGLNEYHKFKVTFLKKYFGTDPPLEDILKVGSSIAPMYYTGNKCAKYLLDANKKDMTEDEVAFLRKYRETRNKIVEHNLDPNFYKFFIRRDQVLTFTLDFKVNLELVDKNNKVFLKGFIDYNLDNEQLMSLCIKYIKSIA